ncbi:MAG: POTRA domain-containing protein, partial [Terriglobia bacterium]
ALKRTGKFSGVDVRLTAEPSGLRLTFLLRPVYYVGVLSFPGAASYPYSRLLQAANYSNQEPYQQSEARSESVALQRFFAEDGYFLARVSLETQVDHTNHLVNLAYHAALNRRAKFGRIAVTGPSAAEVRSLEQSLGSIGARLRGDSLRRGKPYSRAKIRAAAGFLREKLAKRGRLAAQIHAAAPHYDRETNRAGVTFQVNPGPKISIRVEGAWIWKRTLHKLLPFYQVYSFDQDLVEEGKENLESHFQSKGYFDVKVNQRTQTHGSRISLVYRIQKGKRQRVAGITLRGNRHIPGSDLSSAITLKTAHFLSHGRFSDALLTQSVTNLKNYYLQNGFESASVHARIVNRGSEIHVTFQIAEGPQTVVDAVRIHGNKTESISTLAPYGLKLKAGEPYSQRAANQDRDSIMATYLKLGYLDATFRAELQNVPHRPHHVSVVYQIQEGPQGYIQSVLFTGQRHTQPRFIRQTADLKTGVPLNESTLLSSQARLYNLGIFDWASVMPRAPVAEQPQAKVLVKVHEAKRNTLTYGFGIVVEPRTGNLPAGTVALPGLPPVALPTSFQVTEKSFISPSGSIGYSRLNLLGRGETGSASLSLSRLDQDGLLTYANPHFHGKWSSLLSLSAERTSENPLYTARLENASYQLQRSLGRTKRLLLRYSYSQTDLTSLLIPGLVLPQDRSIRLSTFGVTFVHDTRDNPLNAHRGVYQTIDFSVNPKAIGSSANFTRFLGQTAFYHPVRPWLVWANDFRLGVANPFAGSTIPLSERFFSGGADSLRGFPTFGAGPQRSVPACTNSANPSSCVNILVPVGGNELFIWNSEGRFPLPVMKNLGGVVFYDGGNVFDHIVIRNFFNEYTNSVGFGLRYETPLGPIRFDIGRNLNPVPGLKATQFFVTIGQAF